MSEVNNVPESLSIFDSSDLSGGIFGADSPRNETETQPFYADLEFGTLAELGTYGIIAPSASTTRLQGVVMVTNSSSPTQKALFKQSSGSVGAIGKGGYIVCLMDVDNKPSVDDSVNVNLNTGKVGYITSLTSGGVLQIGKELARVVKVFDTHCLISLAGVNDYPCGYVA